MGDILQIASAGGKSSVSVVATVAGYACVRGIRERTHGVRSGVLACAPPGSQPQRSRQPGAQPLACKRMAERASLRIWQWAWCLRPVMLSSAAMLAVWIVVASATRRCGVSACACARRSMSLGRSSHVSAVVCFNCLASHCPLTARRSAHETPLCHRCSGSRRQYGWLAPLYALHICVVRSPFLF